MGVWSGGQAQVSPRDPPPQCGRGQGVSFMGQRLGLGAAEALEFLGGG